MAHTNGAEPLMDDVNGPLEMALIRQYLRNHGVSDQVPFRDVAKPLRVEAALYASLQLAAHEVGDGWHAARRAYVRGPGDGHYRAHCAAARSRSGHLCALCGDGAGGDGAAPPWSGHDDEYAWLLDA